VNYFSDLRKSSDFREVKALYRAAAAAALGPTLNVFSSGSTRVPTAPAFLTFHPTQYLRPFDRPVP
jgi:hypothetical protein